MFIDEIREYCLSFPETSEGFPFDETTLVFKVMGKMFALIDIHEAHSINLKCDPDYAVELRAQYEEITGGYHMNKKYWNTVALTHNITDDFLKSLIRHSYMEVVKTLKKAEQARINELLG